MRQQQLQMLAMTVILANYYDMNVRCVPVSFVLTVIALRTDTAYRSFRHRTSSKPSFVVRFILNRTTVDYIGARYKQFIAESAPCIAHRRSDKLVKCDSHQLRFTHWYSVYLYAVKLLDTQYAK